MAGYYILCRLMGKAFSHRMRYLWLKLSLVSYLLPLWWLRGWYVRFLQTKWEVQLVDVSPYDNFGQKKILYQYNDEVVGLSQGLQKELLFIIIWLTIALTVLIFCLIKFYRSYGKIRRNSELVCDGPVLEQLVQAKKKYGIRRKIKLFLVEGDSSFSGSLAFPFIVMKKEDRLPEYVLKHEMIHVKRRDSLFRVLLSLTVCIHWFNPFIYLLRHQMEEECEMSCDDKVLEKCSLKERAEYSKFLVSGAQKKGKQLPLTLYLKNSKKTIAKRVENIMDKKEKSIRKTLVCFGLLAAFLFGSSLVVLAYDHVYITENSSPKKVGIVTGAGYFQGEGEESAFGMEVLPILYVEQFVDGVGNIYDLTGRLQADSTYLVHQYVPGQYTIHEADNSGGCNIYSYYADKCIKCGYIHKGEYISTMHYAVCAH